MMLDGVDVQQLETIAVDVARDSAALIRTELGHAADVGAKSSPTDVVTQTDLDAERLIRRRLIDATPDAGFLGEEGGVTSSRARLQWVVDPLDGTVNFLYALPVIAVSIAAAVDGQVVAGAVVDVVRGETFSAATGRGARVDDQPMAASECPDLARALVTTGFSYRASIRDRQGDVVRRLLPVARDIRCFGSAALQLCWVGAGRADAYFERDIKVWDYAAGALIAAEAGAITELPCPENDGLVIVASPAVFERLRAIVEHDR
jgi:myo-inositol-1(or 4)-monophosphatase